MYCATICGFFWMFFTQTGDFGAPPCEPTMITPCSWGTYMSGTVTVLPLFAPVISISTTGRPWKVPIRRPPVSL